MVSKLFYSHILIENKLGDYKPWKQYKKYSTIPPNPHKALPTTRLSLSHFKETHGNAYPNPRYVDPTDPDIFKDTKVTRKKGKGFSNVGNLKTLREKNHGK